MKFFAEKSNNWSFLPTIFYEASCAFCGEPKHSVGVQFGPYIAGVEWVK